MFNAVLEKIWGITRNLGAHPAQLLNHHNFKISSLLLHGYHTLQLKNIVIPAIAFSPTISKFYQPANWIIWDFFGDS